MPPVVNVARPYGILTNPSNKERPEIRRVRAQPSCPEVLLWGREVVLNNN